MKVFKNGEQLKKPVFRYDVKGEIERIADAEGDKTWYPASEFKIEKDEPKPKQEKPAPQAKEK